MWQLSQIVSQNSLFDAGSSSMGGGKSENELHRARLGQLNGDAGFGRWDFEQIRLLQHFHLASRLFQIRFALDSRCRQEELFGTLPIFVGFERNHEGI